MPNQGTNAPATRDTRARFGGILAAAGACLCIAVGVGALLSGFGVHRLAYDLEVLRQRRPLAFPLHMITGGLGLMLAVSAIATRRRPRLHRPLGYVAAVLLIFASLAALPTALASLAHTVTVAAFVVQAIVCTGCLVVGWRAIRGRRIRRHRAAMLAAAATAFGAVILRGLLVLIDGLALPHEPAYAVAAWVAWLAPLALVLAWQSRAGQPSWLR
jgi:uncharacterized membrane protein YozB (DUF420 family)